MSRRVQILLVVAAVLLLRLPFLNQAIQGDDVYFLYGAEHAQEDPWHPLSARYVFLGAEVDMRGHTHGPVDSWILALLIRLCGGGVKEIPFHLAYTLLSLVAALAAWWIACRYTERPLIATLLFLLVPPFVVNGNSLEADLPFVALWLLVVAFYLADRPVAAVLAAVLATLTSYQAILLSPILFLLPGVRRRWSVLAAPPVALVLFQTFERFTGGSLPAAVLAGYMQDHGWQSLTMKWKNAVGLTGHLAVNIVSPIVWLGWRRLRADRFLLSWIAVFFAGALVIFFAGAARYLLPLALPVCILASRSNFAIPAIAVQGAYSLALAVVSYQHWDGYRKIAAEVPAARRIFVNGEWGLRHYLEERGAVALTTGQTFHPGDIVVSTGYASEIDAPKVKLFEREIQSPIPLRMMFLGGGSAFSTVGAGLTPISISTAPLDRVRVESIAEVNPTLAVVKIGTPEGAAHIVNGIANHDGWSLDRGTVALLRPGAANVKLRAKFYIPPAGAGREVQLSIDGVIVARQFYKEDGVFTLDSPPLGDAKPGRAIITIATDKPLRVPSDNRALGVVLSEIGFVAGNE